ncbi:MAG: CHAP domain-containing protein [Actinophytocola sp.]|uniref:CHAP domain-containing protein n=1 Tax=Actinophytocola sp. TaxID=1872138 RepID=UPI00132AC565|nr:CHAP domain-containing protein [Actinophytocola sp.]MPZ83318.1 CHAP domain-containing protein [Actinophytocola sp.]
MIARRALLAVAIAALVAAGVVAPAWAAGLVTAPVWDTGGEPLFVRSGPGTGHEVVGQLAEGTEVGIECQTEGTVVDGTALWDYLPDHGGYVSDRYLYTGYDGRHPDLSECDGAEPPPPSGDIRDRIVDIAAGELGSTDGWSYHPGQGDPSDAWCQYFVNWVWRAAGVLDMFGANGFTGDFYHWAVDRGLVRDGYAGITAGDAVLFGTGPSDPGTSLHVGIVVAVHGDGSIETIDGNYASSVARVGPFLPGNATTHEPGDVYAVVSPTPLSETPAEPPADPPAELTVNGNRLTEAEAANVRWIADNTVPRIGGDLDAAASVTWWSLKEGVLGLDNPHEFSHCDNRRLGPLESCAPECCWQVGISAVQEPTFDLARTTETAERLYPGRSADEVLAHTATYAGYPPGTPGYDAIVNSTGAFRNSWLLRNHGVGFVLNAPQVEAECVVDSLSWCYGTGWDTTARYAPTKAAALRSIDDLRAILADLV